MRWFFFKTTQPSRECAKNRLCDVLKQDRTTIGAPQLIEKIREEISDLLKKYMRDGECEPSVNVSYSRNALCIIDARVPIRTKEK